MPEQLNDLGGRLSLLDPAKLEGSQRKLYDYTNSTFVSWAEAVRFQSKTADGKLIGPFNAVLYSPENCGRFLALQRQEGEHTALTGQLRQIVILSVGSIWKTPYELYAHAAVAKKAGFSNEMIKALGAGEPCDELSETERIAQQFTLQLAAEHLVDNRVFATAYSSFGAKGLVDMVVLAGCYFLVCSVLNVFHAPTPGNAELYENEKKQ